MFDELNLIKIGRIYKSHGVNGLVKVKFKEHFDFEKLQLKEPVFIMINELLVPYFIKSYKAAGGSTIINFLYCENLREADELAGAELYVKQNFTNNNKHKKSRPDINNYEVFSKNHGVIGTVKAINEIPGNPVMEIQNNNNIIFVPYVDEFIIKISHTRKTIEINPPEGLIELYL